MKRILLLCAGLIIMLNAKAQFPMGGAQKTTVTGRITAIIIDSLTKKPIDYATVSLAKAKDGKTINGGVTDEKGKVILSNVSPDEYKLSVGFMGYQAKTILIKTTEERPDNNAGTISLSATASLLKEVSVVGTKAVIENKIDRMVYNAEADGTNAGGDATDVMRKVPMLSVDINGNVQLRGSSVRVLINGKPSGTMANSVADALKMLPADQIKSVEVITSPSAKYDAEGSGGIINIITKKSNAQGVSGTVNATAGTRQNTGSFNLTAKTNRLSVNTALGSQLQYPQSSTVDFVNTTKIGSGAASTVFQSGLSDWTRQLFNGSLGVDYDFNAYNNISSNAKYTHFYNGGPGEASLNINGGSAKNSSSTDMGNTNIDWNMDYKKTSKKAGEEFSISGQYTNGKNSNDFTNILTVASLPQVITASSNTGKNGEYTAQTDYVYPFSKSVIFEVGAKGIFRNIESQYGNNTGQDFDYIQNVGAGYSTISFNLTKKIQFKGGLRAEYTDIDINNGSYSKDYFNLFPSAIVSQTFNGTTTLKLSYNRRVQRPSLSYLNPFRNEANQFSVFQGNPTLNPELSDNYEFGYSTYIKGSVINASIFYRHTNGVIENYNDVDKISPTKVLTTFQNVGNVESFGVNLFASYNPKPKWTLMTNLSANTYQVDNVLTNTSSDTYINYTLFGRSAVSFSKGWTNEIFLVFNGARRTFQSKSGSMVFYGGSIKKQILKTKGTIGLNVLNPFSKDLVIKANSQSSNPLLNQTTSQTQEIHYPLRSFGINFSYSFGKLKFTEKKKIRNDDQKQDQNQQGGQGGMGGSGR
jgi:outer membrane receptor protein involved in Fe transport